MDHFLTNWGQPRSDVLDNYNAYPIPHRPRNLNRDGIQRTQEPIVTGTSVLGLTYKDGIMLAADNLGSYGSLSRFKDIQRLHSLGSSTVIAVSGDMADYQHLKHFLDEELLDNEVLRSDEHKFGPTEYFELLKNVMYNARSRFNPMWNSVIVGGYKNGKRFLGYVNLLGTSYTASTIATGYGAYIAVPLLRDAVENREDELTEEQAREIMETCLKVLFYRDARSLNKYQIATITAAGASISESRSLETEWSFAEGIRGYGTQTQ